MTARHRDKQIYQSGETQLIVDRFASDDFVVGVDNSIIRFGHAVSNFSGPTLPSVECIDFNLLTRLDLHGLVHIVDVRADDPGQYRFIVYGGTVSLDRHADYHGKKLCDGASPLMVEATKNAYAEVKRSKARSFSQVHANLEGQTVQYRRLLVPFSSNGSEVTHLAVALAKKYLGVGA